MGTFTKFGHERANPEACPTNNIRLKKEGCTQRSVCQDSGVIDMTGRTVVGFNYLMGDTPVEKSFDAIDVSTAEGLALLKQKVDEVVTQYEVPPTKTIFTYEGTELTVVHYGAGQIVNLVLDNGPSALTRACNVINCIEYKGTVSTDVPSDIVLGAESYTANSPATVTDTEAETFATAIMAAITATCKDVEVEADADAGNFIVSVFVAQGGDIPTIGGSTMVNCGYCEVFIA